MQLPNLPVPDGVDLRGNTGQTFVGNKDITLNGILYRQTANGVFRVENEKLIPITASERAMFTALDNGTYKPTQNTTPVVNNNQKQSNGNLMLIGLVLVGILLVSKGN